MTDLNVSTPKQEDIDPALIRDFIIQINKNGINLHSLVILRNGKQAFEAYWKPYEREKTHTLFSASKSFTAIGVGFAIQDGLLDMNNRVLDFFPDKLPAPPCLNMGKMTVRNLLTMTTGFNKDPHDFPFQDRTDWIRNFLTAYVPLEPGTHFEYSTHASYMLSAIVQKVTGHTLYDYLNAKLFQPLGFQNAWWETSPQGVTTGGWGLMIRTVDFAKFGQFLLERGSYQGQRMLNESWVSEAIAKQVDTSYVESDETEDSSDLQAGYGYQIWRCAHEDAFMASGGFGQYSIVLPHQNAVIAVTAGGSLDGFFTLLWKYLIPAFDHRNDTSYTDRDLAELTQKLTIPQVVGLKHDFTREKEFSGIKYMLSPNKLGFQSIRFDFDNQQPTVTFGYQNDWFTIPIGYQQWTDGVTSVPTEETDTDVSVVYEHVSTTGAWQKDGRYQMITCYNQTPFYDTFNILFRRDHLLIAFHRSARFSAQTLDTVIYGTIASELDQLKGQNQ